MKDQNIVFTFASSEVNALSRAFIQIAELGTGKLKLKKLYDQYLKENRPPENFWHDAVEKLRFNVTPYFYSTKKIPKTGGIHRNKSRVIILGIPTEILNLAIGT